VNEPTDLPRPVGRPRDPHVDRAVLEATFNMLAEQGYEGLTIEAVAHAAGVSKNAIYRRWPDKVTMVLDAIRTVAPHDELEVDTGDIRADMATMLRGIVAKMRQVDGRLSLSLASELQRHPELGDAVRTQLLEPRRRELHDRVRRAVEAGQVPADADVELLTDVGPALLFHRFVFDGVVPDDDYVERVLRQFWS
jgi:AcrR family transcriptional regulator